MTSEEPRRERGYRGALPTREDRLAKPWILTVAGVFILVIALSLAGIPSRFIPDPTTAPLPSVPAASPSGAESESASPSESASEAASESASPSPTPTP